MKRILTALSTFCLVAISLTGPAGMGHASEASTARRFEHARLNQPELIAFLKEMPKGADLHNHASGAVYAETRLDAAIRAGVFFDSAACTFVSREHPSTVPAADLLARPDLVARYLDAVSMRGAFPSTESGHDHFFRTFSLFGDIPASAYPRNAVLAEVVTRAKAQHLQYLEMMTGTAPSEALDAAMSPPPAVEDLERALAEMRPRFPALLAASKAYLDARDVELAAALGVEPPITGAGGPINVRYVFTVNRNAPNEWFFAQMACGMALAQADDRIAAVNIAAPEDDVPARQNFETQMKMIDFLWSRLGRPNLTLHAGELTLACSPVEVMRSRIRETIERGHARRIGHGVSVAWEDDLPGLLREMRDQRIAVEICLSSNAGILGVEGDAHPFNLYRDAGVAVSLCTDDEGVNRSNLTMEFVRAVQTYRLSYPEVKTLIRNSVRVLVPARRRPLCKWGFLEAPAGVQGRPGDQMGSGREGASRDGGIGQVDRPGAP